MYGSVAGWIAYAALRGLAVADDAAAAAALVRASDYIRTRYVIRFAPDYTDADPRVTEATYIAAAYELETPGFWTTTVAPAQAKVLTRAGSIGWTPIGGATGLTTVDGVLPVSPAIDALLGPMTRYGMPAVMAV